MNLRQLTVARRLSNRSSLFWISLERHSLAKAATFGFPRPSHCSAFNRSEGIRQHGKRRKREASVLCLPTFGVIGVFGG